jgi:septum site-determining protein MinD
MSRIIGIVSAKGGVGKTVITINLAAALTELKRDVVAVDADLKLSGLGLQLGMYYFPVTLNDVLNRKINIQDALYIHSSGLSVIPASLCMQEANISQLSEVLNSPFLADKIVLVDTPPGLEKNTVEVMEACNEIIIVTLPEIPSVADIMKTITVAEKIDVNPLGIVINQYRKDDKEQITPKEIEAACNLPVIGVIPEDKTIRKSIFRRTPAVFLNPYSKASIEFMRIAAKLAGENYYRPPKFAFFRKFFRRGKG